MFHDVQKRYNDPRHSKSFQSISFHEFLYADDTLIIAKKFASATKCLHLIEEKSDYLELNLNRSKCSYIAYKCQGQIRFQNGEPMKSSGETTYLRVSVTQHIDPKHEIKRKVSATMAILKKLDIVWIKTHCNKKWKRLVFNAVITSKVLYGLETLEPREAAGRSGMPFPLQNAMA